MKQGLGRFQKQSSFHPQRCGTPLAHQCVIIPEHCHPGKLTWASVHSFYWGRVFPGVSDCKESACNAGRPRFDPWVKKIPWRRKWLPTPVFLPRESHGQRSLVGYSPWVHKESDTTEGLTLLSYVGRIDWTIDHVIQLSLQPLFSLQRLGWYLPCGSKSQPSNPIVGLLGLPAPILSLAINKYLQVGLNEPTMNNKDTSVTWEIQRFLEFTSQEPGRKARQFLYYIQLFLQMYFTENLFLLRICIVWKDIYGRIW